MTPHETADLVMRKGGVTYVAEVKRVSEGRSDRLVPLVARAVLQARHHADVFGDAEPLVIVIGRAIPPKTAESVREFMRTYAADVAIGLIDGEGLREFVGPGLEPMNRGRSGIGKAHGLAKRVDLFSDLNQWLLKILLAADLADPRLLNAPSVRYHNATELARAANVSVMTAFRFIEQLRSQRHLHESSPFIRLVRVDELLERWRMTAAVTTVTIRGNWLFASEKQKQISRASQSLGRDICLRSYAAADALGYGIVRGVPTDFYMRTIPHDLARTVGIVRAEGAGGNVVLAVPRTKESVFRGAVDANGIRATDILQVWLDVGHDPARGREQADHLRRKVIAPMLKRASQW